MGRVVVWQVGAQQVATLAAARLSELILAQTIGEGLGAGRLIDFGQADLDQAIGPAGVLLGGAELDQELVAAELLLAQRAQAAP